MSWRRGQTYSQDLRDRVLAAEGSARQVAARFGVSVSYVIKARQRLSRTGAVTPRPQKPPVIRRLVHLHAAIEAEVAARPETTIAELRDWLLRRHGVSASMSTVWKSLSRLGLTRKKSILAAEQARADIAEARRVWRELQPRLKPEKPIFLDETWAKTNMRGSTAVRREANG